MKLFIFLSFVLFLLFCSCSNDENSNSMIASGQMPCLTRDKAGILHLVYGNGDSILYCYSSDHNYTFSRPYLISILPKLAASHTRGPQIAAIPDGLIVTACNESGDIFSYSKTRSGEWSQTARVNDIDTVAKENLMALAADERTAFAVWLDLRDRHNKIFGARSMDGGKTWSKNIMIYTSPDTTVCECCKPSVQVNGDNIYIMFRNWLNGNRDLYLIQSSNGGRTFGEAQKIGNGTWALNGCPMDGGSLIAGKNGDLETVWNRKGSIYACKPGKQEQKLGEGRNCTMESVNGKNIYAWVEKGEIIIVKPGGIRENVGKGQQPVLKAVNDEQVICIWGNDKKIFFAIVQI